MTSVSSLRLLRWLLVCWLAFSGAWANADQRARYYITDAKPSQKPLEDLETDAAPSTPVAPEIEPDDLVPPFPDDDENFSNLEQFAYREPDIGVRSRDATPNVIADFFGQGAISISAPGLVPFAFPTRGFIVAGLPGDPNATLVFEANGGTADDFFTTGTGSDASGDGLPDTFAMTEPLPPNEVPTLPGPEYTFAGGRVVYTNVPDGTPATPAADGPFQDGEYWFASYAYNGPVFSATVPANGLGVRRLKLSENNSPIPRHRVFFSHNFFNDAVAGLGDVSRYTVGMEKTFFDNQCSVEIRAPFAATLSSDQVASGSAAPDAEFGNLGVFTKVLLYESATCLWSGGIGIALPTADKVRVFQTDGTQILRIENESVHLLPYAAMLWTPHDRFYTQAFAQLDLDPSGNSVYGNFSGGELPKIGTLNTSNLGFVDVSSGYWLHQAPGERLSGIVPTAELHYSTTLQDADRVTGNGFDLQTDGNRIDTLNLTLGTHFLFGTRLTVTPAMVVPLRRGSDQQFDFESIVHVNYGY